MLKVLVPIVAAMLIVEPACAAGDPRGDDAVMVFNDLCVSLFTGKGEAELDPTRFDTTKISEQDAREIKPEVKGVLWDVTGTKSGVHMLVHYEPSGMCVVEVAEADEVSIRARFERLVQQTSTTLKASPRREPDKRNRIGEKDATTSMWRMQAPPHDVMLAVTTYPDPKFMIQHLMTVSYVK